MDGQLKRIRKVKRHIRGNGFEIIVDRVAKTFRVTVFRPTCSGYWSMTRVTDKLVTAGYQNAD